MRCKHFHSNMIIGDHKRVVVEADDFFTSYTYRNMYAKFGTFVRRVTDSRFSARKPPD